MNQKTHVQKHVRELELAQQLKSVFQELPVSALLNLVANLADGVAAAVRSTVPEGGETAVASKAEATVVSTGWTSTEHHVQYFNPPEVMTEVRVPQDPSKLEGNADRLDLVVPVPPFTLLERVITCLVFELKLGGRDEGQLTRYAQRLDNSIVISVSKEVGFPPVEYQKGGSPGTWPYWVCQGWDHLYYALQELLSGDPRHRVTLVDDPGDLLLNFDYRIPGQDRLTFTCERLMETIEARNLLANRQLTLVVPEGGQARASLDHDPPYYEHSAGWQSGYRYVAVVRGNVLVSIYEVLESVTTNHVSGAPPAMPPTLKDNLLWTTLTMRQQQRVSVLDSLNPSTLSTLPIGKKYSAMGAIRPKTFVFSHRYLDCLTDLNRFFT